MVYDFAVFGGAAIAAGFVLTKIVSRLSQGGVPRRATGLVAANAARKALGAGASAEVAVPKSRPKTFGRR